MIGIFGGTFDPIHYGHIEPALSVKQALNLEQIRFIPNSIPPHRASPWLSAEQRLSLLRCALKQYPDSVVDLRELNRDGPSYMVDTLTSITSDFPGKNICLIIGMDAFFGIDRWHQWQGLFDLCHLIVTTRPGFHSDTLAENVNNDNLQFLTKRMTQDAKMLHQHKAGKILLQAVPQLDISSSQIRADLQNGEDVRQWMSAETYQKLRGFINDNR